MILALLFACVVFIVYSTTKLKLHPFLALIAAALIFGLFSGMPFDVIITSVNDGFGSTLGSIGLVIILGVIIGAFLENSGGVYGLAEQMLKIVGTKRVATAMAAIGYLVSIPVFADSGFVILSSLNRALTKRAGLSLAGTSVALAMGLLASHTMVPPTPGPIAVAGILGADLGLVIFWGVVASILSLFPVMMFVKMVVSKIYIDPNPDLTDELLEQKMEEAPGMVRSSLPIIVPIVLIVMKSLNGYLSLVTIVPVKNVIDFVGTPVIALLIGFSFALLTPKKLEKSMLSIDGWVGAALKDAAIILMITGAGGVFGKVLQNSSLPEEIGLMLGTAALGLWLPFIISAALKSAQGSSTVAMITTASIVLPLLPTMGLSSEISVAFSVLAIGAGSAVVSHANDSFFWIVTQMSDMNVSTGYRTHTLATAILGVSAMVVLSVLHLLLN
jgi:GntP family gluconate:H+ symporter